MRFPLPTFLLIWISAFGLSACDSPKWIATGSWQKPSSPDCDLRGIEQQIIDNGAHPEVQAEIARVALDHCHYKKDLPLINNPWQEIITVNTVADDYQKLGNVIDVTVPAPGGLVLKGRLGLRPSAKPLPLVIIQCGIQCGLNDSALKYAFEMLFEESPFHVFLLPSMSSFDFQKDNQLLSVGGVDEAQQIFRVAKYLQSPEFPYQDRFSSVHVFGFSMGGLSTLLSAVINSQNPRSDGSAYVQSFTAGCPVVDLKTAASRLYRWNVGGIMVGGMFWRQARQLWHEVPDLHDLLKKEHRFMRPHLIPQVLARGSMEHLEQLRGDASSFFAPFQNMPLSDIEDFWKANDLRNYLPQLKQPVFIWAAADDPVVRTKYQTHLLEDVDASAARNLPILVTKHGSHCAFGSYYGWRSTGVILRALLLSHMPELLRDRHVARKTIDLDYGKEIPERAKFIKLKWRATEGSDQTELVSIYRSGASDKRFHAKMPLATFGKLLFSPPKTAVEAQAVTRWLNANVWVVDRNDKLVAGHERPDALEWMEY